MPASILAPITPPKITFPAIAAPPPVSIEDEMLDITVSYPSLLIVTTKSPRLLTFKPQGLVQESPFERATDAPTDVVCITNTSDVPRVIDAQPVRNKIPIIKENNFIT